jgi:hypothetical protein
VSTRRWKVEKDYAVTECEEPHPMRLPRHPEQPQWNDWSERADAIRAGKKGYLCPGGQEHWYPIWVVVDTTSTKDYDRQGEIFDNYHHARAYRDELNAKAAPTNLSTF